jgi:uncharacterized membrane protein YgdD (TMEM256/DUF423 family)
MNIILLLGSLLGLSSLIIASYIDHSLALNLSPQAAKSLSTALHYHQLYAIMITLQGLVVFSSKQFSGKWLLSSAYLFIIGTLLFSLSIYLSYGLHFRWIIYLTPIGGIGLMLGWCCLILSALKKSENRQ